ncbi:MAG TPA: putative metal-dependent hydrolase [Bacteroidia bacterium]|jgi:hypothetical protein|nr:putative metal-dependent hydrolase [Bacteroidia bacterium]
MEQQIVMEELKYPIGKFKRPESFTSQDIKNAIQVIQEFPSMLSKEVWFLDDENLKYLHRPDGWTIRQIVHHCADSHMNAFIRTKLALTEDNPTIKPYKEAEWARLSDSTETPVDLSLKILDGLHSRWVTLLNNIKAIDLDRTLVHPEHNRQMKLVEIIFLYAWHCGHHIGHIKNARKFKNQF